MRGEVGQLFSSLFSDCVLDGDQMRTRVTLNLIALQARVAFKGSGKPLTQTLCLVDHIAVVTLSLAPILVSLESRIMRLWDDQHICG